MNSNDIFKLLNPLDNTILSSLDRNSLNSIVEILDIYYLNLRDSIGKYDNETVGFEFEVENYDENLIKEELTKRHYYDEGYRSYFDDHSSPLCEYPNIYEISTPILRVSNINWNRIKELCFILNKYSSIGNNCGAHIHVGAQILENKMKSLTNFATLIIAYENIIARFFYGNYINERISMHIFAPLISNDWYDEYLLFEKDYYLKQKPINVINILSGYYEKNQFINMSNAIHLGREEINNTIEFRGPNGTLDPVICQNNCNLIIKMLKYCNNSKFDLCTVENRIKKNINKLGKYYYSRQIDLESACEFCDLIFDNNFDKIYFLRQYLKDKKTTNKDLLVKSKSFTTTKY